MSQLIEFSVNGVHRRILAPPGRTLLNVLRENLDLTGAKLGCGEGQCGSCTVLVDGRPVRSCITPAASVAGRRVTTIEGLEQNGRLDLLQESFLKAGALQCGFCTSGMIMAAAALLRQTPNPDEAQIAKQMQGNICRCGTYPRIVEAVRLASSLRKGASNA